MKIRFGEIEIGSKFSAFGQEMMKTNEYNARTTSTRGKRDFQFQKRNLVDYVSNWDSVVISLIRRTAPKMNAHDIFSIQPMSAKFRSRA